MLTFVACTNIEQQLFVCYTDEPHNDRPPRCRGWTTTLGLDHHAGAGLNYLVQCLNTSIKQVDV